MSISSFFCILYFVPIYIFTWYLYNIFFATKNKFWCIKFIKLLSSRIKSSKQLLRILLCFLVLRALNGVPLRSCLFALNGLRSCSSQALHPLLTAAKLNVSVKSASARKPLTSTQSHSDNELASLLFQQAKLRQLHNAFQILFFSLFYFK